MKQKLLLLVIVIFISLYENMILQSKTANQITEIKEETKITKENESSKLNKLTDEINELLKNTFNDEELENIDYLLVSQKKIMITIFMKI